ERAQGAEVQLVHVVAGHVLDDAPAGFRLLPLVVDGAEADDVVPEGAAAVAARAGGVDGQGAAEGGPLGPGHVHRQPPLFGRQQAAEGGQGDARTDGDGHVAGGVVEDVVQGGQPDGDAGPLRRQAEVEAGAAPDGEEGAAVGGAAAHDVAQFGDG